MKKILFVMLCSVLLSGCSKKEIYPEVKNSNAEIKSFSLLTESGANALASVSINNDQTLITIKINTGITVSRLFPSAVISEGAVVVPAMGVYTDFSRERVYQVTSGDRQNQRNWTVKIQN